MLGMNWKHCILLLGIGLIGIASQAQYAYHLADSNAFWAVNLLEYLPDVGQVDTYVNVCETHDMPSAELIDYYNTILLSDASICTQPFIVTPPGDVVVVASHEIRLLPGFQADAGSDFHAFIDLCTDFTSYDYREVEINEGQPTARDLRTTSVYPNPAKDLLYVRNDVEIVRIYDVYGREISFEYYLAGILNISSWNQGLYLIELLIDGQKEVHKVFKQ